MVRRHKKFGTYMQPRGKITKGRRKRYNTWRQRAIRLYAASKRRR